MQYEWRITLHTKSGRTIERQLPRPVKGSRLAKGTLPNTVSKVCNSLTWS